MEEKKTYRFGWLPDYPDFRDYTEDVETIKPLLEKTSVKGGGSPPNPSVDLRMWFSPVEDQGGHWIVHGERSRRSCGIL